MIHHHPAEAFKLSERDQEYFQRATLKLNGYVAAIDAARDHLATGEAQMLPSIFEWLDEDLRRWRGYCLRHLHQVLDAPASASCMIGMIGENGNGPKIMDACEAVDFHVSKAGRAQ